MQFTRGALTGAVWIGLIFMAPAGMPRAEQGTGSKGSVHFTISELMPEVNPERGAPLLSFMGMGNRIHSSELLPSAPGGVTQTRIAVRPESKGSSWLMVADDGPAYRIYQVIERFGVMTRVVSWAGAEHILLGTISFGNFNFESDSSFPLHFKYVQDVGYVHLCGRGTVTTPEGLKHSIGGAKRLDDFIGEIMAEDQLTREGASEALGWLAKTQAEKDKAVPALVKALKDEAMEVRRNAASSLGKIGDLRAQEALKTALQDKDEWVQQVVADALKKIEQSTSEASSYDHKDGMVLYLS